MPRLAVKETPRDLIKRWRQDRAAFRAEAILMEDGTPWGQVAEPWQLEDFAALDALNDDGTHTYRHAYLERPRGHAKTFDLGSEAVAELILGRPRQKLYVAATDTDQARLLFDDVAEKLERHSLLRRLVKIKKDTIVVPETKSQLKVLSADAPSAYGLRPDWIAVDELAEWTRRGLWDSLWSATGKRPQTRMFVISSAGWDKTSIAWEVRNNAEQEADWYLKSRGQCASWISAAWLRQQERTLPRHVFARLHLNQWVEGVGAWLTADEVDSVFGDFEQPTSGTAVVSLDLGISNDRTAVAAARLVGDTVVVTELRTWQGTPGKKVDLDAVQSEVARLCATYRAPLIYDPYQAVLLAQQLKKAGIDVVEFAFTATNRRAMFGALLELVRMKRIRARPDDELRRELLGLELNDRSGGRVDHRKSQHDDMVVAVALAAQHLASKARGEASVTWLESAPTTAPGWKPVTISDLTKVKEESVFLKMLEAQRRKMKGEG